MRLIATASRVNVPLARISAVSRLGKCAVGAVNRSLWLLVNLLRKVNSNRRLLVNASSMRLIAAELLVNSDYVAG